MSNLKIQEVCIRLEEDGDNLEVEFDANRPNDLVYIKDKESSEILSIDAKDLSLFVQEFLYHKRGFSPLSKNQDITEIKLLLGNSNRNCYMKMEKKICIFPNKRYPDEGRNYEVRVTFYNMENIIAILNSYT